MQEHPDKTLFDVKTDRRLWIGGLVLAALLRVVLIERHGLWNNEFITYGVLKLSYGEIISERLSVNHMPLYFLMEKAWTDVFGLGEWSMRAIGAFFGWMAVWATARLARRIGGLRLGIPVLFGAAIHKIWMEAALEARMYSILTWTAAESRDAYIAWTRSQRVGGNGRAQTRPLVRWAAVGVFGVYIHMLFISIFAVQSVDAFLRWRRRRLRLSGFAVAWLTVIALSSPVLLAWLAKQTKFEPGGAWEFKGLGILHRQTYRLLWGDYDALDIDLLRAVGYVAFALALVGLGLALPRMKKHATLRRVQAEARAEEPAEVTNGYRDLTTLATGFVAFMVGIYLAAARSDAQVLGSERYYLTIAPLVLVLGWAGLMHFGFRSRRVAIALGSAVLTLQAIYLIAAYVNVGEGLREAIEIIEEDVPEGRGLIVVMSGGGEGQLGEYYGLGLPTHFLSLDRDEENELILARRIDPYIEKHPEFWVLGYHEKRTALWELLDEHPDRYQPMNERRELGKAKVQLFRRASDPGS